MIKCKGSVGNYLDFTSWGASRLEDINFEEDEYHIFGRNIRTDDPEKCLRDLMGYLASIHQRILMNCSVMLEQCTDPALDHLDHSADIREGLELLKAKRALETQEPTPNDAG